MVEFDMSDLGKMHYFLGIEVVQSNNGIFISQRNMFKKFCADLRWTNAILQVLP